MAESVANNLKLLPDLVAPVETWNATSEPPAKWLNDILSRKIKLFHSHLDAECGTGDKNSCELEEGSVNYDSLDVRWVYVTHCLAYLKKLKDLLIQKVANSSDKKNSNNNYCQI